MISKDIQKSSTGEILSSLAIINGPICLIIYLPGFIRCLLLKIGSGLSTNCPIMITASTPQITKKIEIGTEASTILKITNSSLLL